MLKEKWMIFISVLFIALGAGLSLLVVRQDTAGQFDTVAVNRIVKYTEENWDSLNRDEASLLSYPFSVLNHQGTLIFQSADNTSVSLNEAVKNHNLMMDVHSGNQYLGKALINTMQQTHMQQKITRLSVIVLITFAVLALITLLSFFYLNYKVLKPFHKMKEFAQNIAGGNLDAPLAMDKNNLFGSFTESFDIMREELAKARYREALANKSKKELVASLSHDVKTPLTSIKLISELLEVTTTAPREKEKIHIISEKAEQIDQLITNLFQSSLEELGQLSVSAREEESHKLSDMIRNADFYNQSSTNQIPDCIIKIDPLRMQQVLDNVINNSVKYAGTSIDISFALVSELLQVTIKDYGPGVPEDEIPLLFQKYYRGSKALDEQKDGSGIGLYICHYLMEQMGGSIRCFNHESGFVVELLIPLS